MTSLHVARGLVPEDRADDPSYDPEAPNDSMPSYIGSAMILTLIDETWQDVYQ